MSRAKWVFFVAVFAGCNAPSNALDPGRLLGRDHIIGEPGTVPSGFEPGPGPGPGVLPEIGEPCHGDDPQRICLALKYVVYIDGDGDPVVSQQAAVENVRAINRVWSACNIAFQIDDYQMVRPSDVGLKYQTANFSELDQIRNTLGSDQALLIVTTGTWDRTGSLGNTGANAWTSMPGSDPYGAILERPVGTFSNIISHEIGHYLNLLHINDQQDLMNPIIYSSSTKLYANQCQTARSAASYFWSKMYR